MNIVIIIVSVIAAILVGGAIWGKVERAQNWRRSSDVVIPDMPLNNLKICSGVAEMILRGQFDDDATWYRQLFNTFLIAHFKDEIKEKAAHGNYKSFDATTEVISKYAQYAVAKGFKDNPDGLNSFATLMRAEELRGETGAIVQNAIIYSLAMIIASEAKTPEMKETIKGTAMIRGSKDTMAHEEYKEYMLTNHPRASAIAESIAHVESRKAAHNVVAMMGYLIDKGQAGGSHETERERGLRIFDEQMIDMPDFV